MKMTVTTLLVLVCATVALGQRPFFAGSRPIGIPEVTSTTTEALGDRFGEGDGSTTTLRPLPIEANGDRELVDRLSKLPIDHQPFWLINWQALEANRQKPHTYPQKPNQFVDSIQGITNSGDAGTPNGNSNSVATATNPGNVNSNTNSSGVATSNRFGGDELPKVPSKDLINKSGTSLTSSSNSGNGTAQTNATNKPFVPQAYYL